MSEIHDRRREDFERLFRQHAGTVTAWAQRRDTDAERVQDLVAETFMVAWRRLEDIPAGDERPWLGARQPAPRRPPQVAAGGPAGDPAAGAARADGRA